MFCVSLAFVSWCSSFQHFNSEMIFHNIEVSNLTARETGSRKNKNSLCSSSISLHWPVYVFTFKAHVSCLEDDLRLPGLLVTPPDVAIAALCCVHNKPSFYGALHSVGLDLVLSVGVTSRHRTLLLRFSCEMVDSISKYRYWVVG